MAVSIFPPAANADIPTTHWERCPVHEEAVRCEVARDGSFDNCAVYAVDPDYRLVNSNKLDITGPTYERQYCVKTRRSMLQAGMIAMALAGSAYALLIRLEERSQGKPEDRK